jgi:serine/threonine-protein kinase
MATVYLARDIRHDRNVAVKVLDPELGAVLGVERFLAEIKVTANLQHPNLLPLFDSGAADGLLYYVMPFVEGETLRARMEREKQLPIDEAVRIASAAASALQYAHERHVIHRDLKPENILLQAGQPVVADFGIALAVSNAGGARITQTGLSLGTPQYMSPEQATGDRVIDGRSDIYSLGAILYELLTGDPPHAGSTAQAVIARVLTEKPRGVRVSRPNVPEHVALAIERALEKLPADRWASAGAFREALQSGMGLTASATAAPVTGSSRNARRGWRSRAAWIVPAVIALNVAAFAWMRRPAPASEDVLRYVVSLSPGTTISPSVGGYAGALAMSRDGKYLAYVAGKVNDRGSLYLLSLDRLEPRRVSERALYADFSPDGKWIAFRAFDGKLWKARVDGGAPIQLADIGVGPGLTWATPEELVYATNNPGDGLWRISVDGGEPRRLTVVDTSDARFHYAPRATPDGKYILFTGTKGSFATGRIGVASMATGKFSWLSTLPNGFPLGIADGQMLMVTAEGSLVAAPLDLGAMRVGPGIQLTDRIDVQAYGASVAYTPHGDLAYSKGSAVRQLVRVDERGVATPMTDQARTYAHPRLSPDGKRIAFEEAHLRGIDIWVYDIGAKTFVKLTSTGVNDRPEWTPDGKAVMYLSNSATSLFSIWSRDVDGVAPSRRILERPNAIREVVPMPDGKALVFREDAAGNGRDIYLLPFAPNAVPIPLAAGPADELMPRPSPDGKLLAYMSNESGRHEVYVRSMTEAGGRVAVSSEGGAEPLWSRDGGRLYYRAGTQLVEATISRSPGLAVAGRRTVMDVPFLGEPFHPNFDVLPDGKTFVMVKSTEEDRQLVMVRNWIQELRQRTGAKR